MISLAKRLVIYFTVTVIPLALLVGFVYSKVHYSNHKEKAEAQATQYAQDLGYKINGASCTNKDTDGDSYVSCALNLEDGTLQRVECVGNIPPWPLGPFTTNKGCKLPKLMPAKQ